MNQILSLKNKKHLKKFKILLFVSIFIIIFSTSYILFIYRDRLQKDYMSDLLINNFNIEYLYNESKNNIIIQIDENTICSIIGIIEIPKINIKYPILSDTNDDFLKISACRFFGPLPNKIGNICIAAHNYDDNRFFSNLNKLRIGDIVNIYDINDKVVSYSVYDIFETSKTDTSCTNQNTKGNRELTLITCNNVTKNRLIVKAIEI